MYNEWLYMCWVEPGRIGWAETQMLKYVVFRCNIDDEEDAMNEQSQKQNKNKTDQQVAPKK